MAYRMQLRNNRPRIVYETYLDGVRKQKHFPKSRWKELGIYDAMTHDEIKDKLRSLNNDAQLKRWQAVRNDHAEQAKRNELAANAFAFPYEVNQFLDEIVEDALTMSKDGERSLRAHWNAVQTMLVSLSKHPWEMRPGDQPRYYISKGWSVSYASKVHSLFNRWGLFSASRRKATFVAKPLSRIAIREIGLRHVEYKREHHIADKESVPLTEDLLSAASQRLSKEQYQWLYLTTWLGLRPHEVDDLHDKAMWNIVMSEGTKCIDIKQRKLKHLDEAKQWKLIPILFPEQELCLEIIKENVFERPLVKTLRSIHPGLTCYGGRKHFEWLMIEVKGYNEYTVADWMGHKDVAMLIEKYRNRRRVRLR